MDINEILLFIIAAGSCIFLAGFVLKKTDFLWRFLLRGVTGSSFIWIVCVVMSLFNLNSPVGVNVWTAGVSAILGMPGVLMLYVIGIYSNIA